jgi:hypothetical protein
MSLLKAKDLEIKVTGYDKLERDFLGVITTSDEYTTMDLISLVQIYAKYACEYLVEVSQTLQKPSNCDETMKLMNSYIAEVTAATNNKYYNKEHGFSLIDKAVQEALENDGIASYGGIFATINEINESYVEKEIEEE